MATASSAKAEVGTIKVAIGDVKVVGVDGVVRTVGVGDKVFAKEVIQTAANAVVQVQLADGRMLDLGRDSKIALDDDLLGTAPTATAKAASPADDIAALQAAIAAGADPSQVAAATAAGGAPGAGGAGGENEGHEPVIIGQANSRGPVTSGFQTTPIGFAPAATLPPDLPLIPPVISVGVEVQVSVAIDQPKARNDFDVVNNNKATGNVIDGTNTVSGLAGADSKGSEGATVTSVGGVGNNGGVITVAGQYGVLVINPDGSYEYTRNPGQPDNVLDKFTYTLTDGSGDTSTADLVIDVGGGNPNPNNDVPIARNDTDEIPTGGAIATGNVITGVGTTSTSSGIDTVGSEGATVTAVAGGTNNGGVITVDGQYGMLVINPDGRYIYTRDPDSPDNVIETFTYTLTDGSGDSSTANLVIDVGSTPDTPPENPPENDDVVISGNAASLVEGTGGPDRIVNFVIKLDHPYALPVTVTYNIVSNGANSPNEPGADDYRGVLTATVTIPAGQTSFIVPVSIVPDHLVESSEGFNIVLSNPINASINPNADTAFVTIIDDDLPPTARDDAYSVKPGLPNQPLDSVLTHKDAGEADDDSGDGPGETLVVVKPDGSPIGAEGFTITTEKGGTVVIQADGTFTYTPPPGGISGPDTFLYSMTDAVGGSPIGNGTDVAKVTLTPDNQPPTVKFDLSPGDALVTESALAIGSDPASLGEEKKGTFTIADPDGLGDLLSVTINGQTVPLSGLPGTVIDTPAGKMTIDSYDPVTGVVGFTYLLETPVEDIPGQPEQDVFTVTVTDKAGAISAPATLPITIVDDLPTARDDTDTVSSGSFVPETGNVLTGQGTAGGLAGPGADTKGADSAVLTGISNFGGGAVPQNPDGSFTVIGQYGVLTINPNGEYSYARNLGTPGGVQEKFTYTLTDGDDDESSANLTINIGNAPVELFLKDARVFEAGLPVIGSQAGDGSNITTGAITFNAKDGLQGITVDGILISGAPNQQISHPNGTLTVTALIYDATTGNGTLTYSYKLTQPTAGDTTFDNFTVAVTDKGGGTSDGVLNISIVDDNPTARSDFDAIAAGSSVETGNVLTGAGTAGGLAGPGADTKGADSAAVTGITGPNGAAQPGANGTLVIKGLYGELTIQPNGEYTYTRNPGTAGGVTETFRYTLTDTDGDSSPANLVITIGDAPVTLVLPDTQVKEAGLATGSQAGDGSNVTTGTIDFNSKDGLQRMTLDGVTINPPVVGQPPQIITGPGHDGALAVTGFTYDNTTGIGSLSYSYTLTKNTSGDTTSDNFAVEVTDNNNSKSGGTLTIDIVDDVPTARNDFDIVAAGTFGPETGNVITAVGTVGAPGPDTPGADNATLVKVESNNVPGNAATDVAGVLTINGQYGVLTINPNGEYSYTRTPGTPGGVTDSFRYTLRDGDTDNSAANLDIRIDSAGKPVTDVPSTLVNEAGLSPAGSNAGDGSNSVVSSFTFKSVDGLNALILEGVPLHAPVPGAPQIIIGAFGTLIVTGFGYSEVTGNGFVNYRYTLTENTSGDVTSDNFAVVVSDKDGNNSAGTLKVGIIDDVPTALNDTDAVAAGTFGPETGNVITSAGTTSGVAGKDTKGADDATLTGISGPAGAAMPNADGSFTIAGLYGKLTISPSGDYSYVRNIGTPGGVDDVFTYTLTDSDGDSDPATLTISIGDSPVELRLEKIEVHEAGLPARAGEPQGSGEEKADPTTKDSETNTGVITFNAKDGLKSVLIGGDAVELNKAPNDPDQIIAGAKGTLTVTGVTYDPVTGNGTITYSYTLKDNTAGDTTTETFEVVVTETDNDSSNATLTIDILDDAPQAGDDTDKVADGSFDPETGNVINATGTTNSPAGKDIRGADDVSLTAIESISVPGAPSDVPAGGSTIINGKYGVLTIEADGDYSYQRNNNTPGGVVDVFRYTVTDSDGDKSAANLTISIGNAEVTLEVPGATVNEAGLGLPVAPGSDSLADSETTTGSFTFTHKDALDGVTINGVVITAPVPGQPQTIDGDHGTLTITKYDPVNGVVEYTYTLTEATQGDTTSDLFNVVVKERDGSEAVAPLTITIIDDKPSAQNDVDSTQSAPGQPDKATGNVITAVSTEGNAGADTSGADTVLLTGITGPAGAATPNPNGDGSFTIKGLYGELTIDKDGNYTYTRALNQPGGVEDVFRYTLTDGDGDTAAANLTIKIGDVGGVLEVPSAEVKEEGLPTRVGEPAGSKAADNSETTQGAFTFKSVDGLDSVTLDGVAITAAGQTFAGTFGALVIDSFTFDPASGEGKVEYSYTLADNADHRNATLDDFAVKVTDKDGDFSEGTLNVNIVDDVPSITVTAAEPNLLQVDESDLSKDTTVDFSDRFTTVEGADGATLVYDLDVKSPGADSGVVDVASGQPIYLYENANGVIEGRVGTAAAANPLGAIAFTVTVDQAGKITLNQILALRHPDSNNSDDAVSLGAPDLITLQGTVTDGDGDVRDASLNLGDVISFKDDGPTIARNLTPLPTLTVDETDLSGNASASFAGAFTATFGEDAAGSRGYGLEVTAGADSGLDDVATGNSIYLYKNAAGDIEGRVGTAAAADPAGAIAFTVAVGSTGVVTLDQKSALKHPDATNADDPVNLGGAVGGITLRATITDRDGDSQSATAGIGNGLVFEDDGPTIARNLTPLPTLTVDETDLSGNASASFAGAFTATFGEDAAGSRGYGLEVTAGADSGLDDVATGNSIYLYKNAAGDIEGRVGTAAAADPAGAIAFTVAVGSTGVVTLDQKSALKHPDATNADDPVNLGGAVGGITLRATITDRDGDSQSATAGIGNGLVFEDDGPTIARNLTPLPTLTVDETDLSGNASASFAGAFTATFGEDAAGSRGYGLEVTAGADSGLDDVATGNSIYLYKNAAGDIEGRVGTAAAADPAGAIAFTVAVGSTGVVTLDQKSALKHPDATNADDPVNLGGAVGGITLRATITDRDGDSQSATAGIGNGLVFEDDGPTIARNLTPLPTLTVDETDLSGNASASFAGAFTATFGEDAAGSRGYGLEVTAGADSGLDDVATGNSIYLYKNAAGDIEGRVGTAAAADPAGAIAFTVAVGSTGVVTLDQKSALKHPDATNADDPVNLGGAVGGITLRATITDRDGDSQSATAGIGNGLVFEDDGPTIARNLTPLPTLTVDETDLSGNASASFAGAFTATFGEDAAGSRGYGLEVTAGADSGLDDVATGNSIYLYKNAAGDIEGRVGTAAAADPAGAIAFTVAVGSTGVVTLDQKSALKHPDATNADDPVNLGGAVGGITLRATITDRDGDSQSATAGIGNGLVFEDDGPTIARNLTPLPTLTVDETDLSGNASASFAGAFTATFGEDAAGSRGYGLEVTAGADSGLDDVATGNSIYLYKNAAGDIEGRVGTAAAADPAGAIAFTVAVGSTGVVTLDQKSALKHPDATNADDPVNLGGAVGGITLRATITDRDGDSQSATAGIGNGLVFEDDGPTIARNLTPLPTLTVDETDLSGNASASFAGAFTATFGEDAAGSRGYGLEVTAGADSGLDDVATGNSIYLYKNAAGDIEGRVGTAAAADPAGAIAFTVAVGSTGVVTLDQKSALKHPDATNADDPVNLGGAVGGITLRATITDRDGDSQSATAGIGNGLVFEDDGPTIARNLTPLPTLTVDETDLSGNASASFAGAFTATFGEDAAGSRGYGLEVTAGADSGLDDVATGNSIYLYKNAAGDIEGRVGTAAAADPAGAIAFTVAVGSTGVVTLDQKSALKHPDATNADDPVNLGGAVGGITLRATITDRDGDSQSATAGIGNGLVFEDDGPTIARNLTPLPTLTVDETDLSGNASASFAGAFTATFGEDAAGSRGYGLEVTAGADSGLDDVATGNSIYLYKNAAGDIEGRVGTAAAADPAGAIAFTVAVGSTGVVTLDQKSALKHPDATNADDPVNLGGAVGGITLRATITDRDGDSQSATAGIGNGLVFEDDGPTIARNLTPLPTLTVDETDLSGNASASFAGAFTATFGEDAAGSRGYGLEVTAGADSGLDDVATGNSIYLYKNAAGDIEGRVGTAAAADPAGAIAFTVAVGSTGVVTLDQKSALKHPDATNADDPVNLGGAVGGITLRATITDRDGDSQSATAGIGNGLVFEDDGPTIARNLTPLPTLTVDETDLSGNASASFAGAFTATFGEDAAGSRGYGLEVTAGADSGLDDVATGNSIYLYKNAAGDIEGRVGTAAAADPAGAIAFTVAVGSTGVVTLDQKSALKHPDATNADDPVNLGGAVGGITLRATITDRDGDSQSATAGIGNGLVFEDDGPTIARNLTPLPTLTVDETDLSGNASASFAGAFTATFGEDAAGSRGYGLEVTAGADSGLDDVATGNSIYLYKNAAGDIEGRVGTAAAADPAGAIAFTVAVGSTGVVTLDQKSALKHPDATNADDPVNLGGAVGGITLRATITDRDGDSQSATAGIGNGLVFEDDGPTITANTILGNVDEDSLANRNADAARAGEIDGGGSATATGSLSSLASFGNDGAGGFSIDAAALGTLTAQNLTSDGVALVYTVSGNTLTAKAGAAGHEVYTLGLSGANNSGYTFTLKAHLDHPTLNGQAGDNTENAMNINFGGVVKVTDKDGDSVNLTAGNFAIRVQDDIPVAVDITKSTAAVTVNQITNLSLILDVSGSMSTTVTVNGVSMSRLDAEKQSAIALINAYDNLGDVKVSVTTFSAGSTALGYWLDAGAAIAAINAIGAPNGTTNYTAGLNTAKLAYDGAAAHNGLLANAKDVLYFLSDGVPNPADTGLEQAAEENAWEAFLRGEAGSGNVLGEKITAFAVGVALPDDASAASTAARTALNPIAYNGVTSTDTNAILVPNLNTLTQDLIATIVTPPVSGNLLTDPNPDTGFGADGGHVQSFTVNGVTYTINSALDTITTSGTATTGTNTFTFDNATNVVTVTIGSATGARFEIDMDSANYSYTAQSGLTTSKVENIGYTFTDKDGDAASANLRINVDIPAIVVGENVSDTTAQTTDHRLDTSFFAPEGAVEGSGANDVLIGDVGGLTTGTYNVSLIVDVSGSINDTEFALMKDAIKGLLDKYAGAAELHVDLGIFATGSHDYGTIGDTTSAANLSTAQAIANAKAAIDAINRNDNSPSGNLTNYELALNMANTMVSNDPVADHRQVFFLTDGDPTVGNVGTTTSQNGGNPTITVQAKMDSLSNLSNAATAANGIEINAVAIGLTSAAAPGNMNAIDNTANGYVVVDSFDDLAAQLGSIFVPVALGSDSIVGGEGNDAILGDSIFSTSADKGWADYVATHPSMTPEQMRADIYGNLTTGNKSYAQEGTGAGGNDIIDGGAGNDVIYGQGGKDTIIGGTGNDILTGGTGADTFQWKAGQGAGATDTITDFNATNTAANKDVLDLRDLLQGELKSVALNSPTQGDLTDFLTFASNGTGGVTLSVKTTGTGAVDQTIVLENVTMQQLAGVTSGTPTSADVITNLLANNKLITD